MARIQLGLDVADLDAAVDFYRRLLGVEPAKVRPGYANFAVDEPPLKLVLFENEQGGTINHLGIEVEGADDVDAAGRRLAGEGLATRDERGATCCYARQDKVWVEDPDGTSWEVYTVLADVEPEPVSETVTLASGAPGGARDAETVRAAEATFGCPCCG